MTTHWLYWLQANHYTIICILLSSVAFSGSRGKTQSMMLASTQEITGENKSYENTQFDVIKSKLQQVVHGTRNIY